MKKNIGMITVLLAIGCMWINNAIADNTCIFDKITKTKTPNHLLTSDSGSETDDSAWKLNSFVAPVIPVLQTISSHDVYITFFKPSESNFWGGNVAKYGLSSNLQLIDKNGNQVAYPNGSIKETAQAYWETKNWANPSRSNYTLNSNRRIYTFKGTSTNLTDSSNALTNANTGSQVGLLTLSTGTTYTSEQIINYVRGADILDENNNENTTENRNLITGDVIHSEPLVIRYSTFRNPDDTDRVMVFFGANDGMLHAVNDYDGKEAWAFIPPDQLARLKLMLGESGHQFYIDASPKAFLSDENINGVVDKDEKAYLVCGERKGGTGVFALDVTDPDTPKYLWRINQSNDSSTAGSAPTTVDSELGQSWSEPAFCRVNDNGTITDACFIGGGYSEDNSKGAMVLILNVHTGAIIKKFSGASISAMRYSFAGQVLPIDLDGDGIANKMYAADLGGQLWRFGKFTAPNETPLNFPKTDTNITNWEARVIFQAPGGTKFFNPPCVTLENSFDILFIGSGNQDDACNANTTDTIFAIKDTHKNTLPYPLNLNSSINGQAAILQVSGTTTVNLDYPDIYGWFLRLSKGEKALSRGIVFNKVFYISTFTPDSQQNSSGGTARHYAINYKTGKAAFTEIGKGIPSKPAVVLTDEEAKFFVSVGTVKGDNGDANKDSSSAYGGIIGINIPAFNNFLKLWWREY